MKINNKSSQIITFIIVICMLSSALASCNELPNGDQANEEGIKYKEAIADAFALNETMQNHSFEGTLNLDLEQFFGKESLLGLPYMSIFASGMTWEGIAFRGPEQLDAKINMDLLGQGTLTTIPLLIRDKQLYFQIPLLNLDDEFFMVPMEKISSMNGHSVSALLLTKSALNEINKHIFAAIDPKWVSTTKFRTSIDNQANLSAPIRYEIQITAENADEVELAVATGLNHWIADINEDLTETSTDSKAPSNFATDNNQIQLQPGGSIAVVIDPQGYVTEQFIEITGINSTSEEDSFIFTYGILIDQVNQAPQITAETPKKVLSFQDVITFLENNLREQPKE